MLWEALKGIGIVFGGIAMVTLVMILWSPDPLATAKRVWQSFWKN